MTPQFSIVTPSFNQLEWLRLAAASVADQEGVDVEHIIQDAGTDGIEALLASESDSADGDRSSVKLYVEKDDGMYDALNRGLRKARAEILGHLNSDEQYLPGTLGRVASFFSAHPNIEIVFGDVLVVDRLGNPLSYRRAILPSVNHIRLSHLNTSTCATFFRRSVIEKGHYLDPRWRSIGDAVWIHEILKAKLVVGIYPHLLSVFTLTGNNLSTDNPVSEQEKQIWLSRPDAPAPILRPWYTASHRVRKLLAGAYRKRTFDYKIYTLESPSRRVTFSADKIGGKWRTR